MKKWTFWLSLMLALALLVGCTSDEDPTSTPESEPVEAASVALTVTGPEGTQSLTMDELKALPAAEGWAGGKSSTGRITPPEMHQGVGIPELCELVGGLSPGMGVSVVAKDGYAMTFSYDQIMNGEFTTYDPGTGDETQIDDDLQVIVAYERSGEPIPAEADGPLRIAVLSDKNNQVVDGHWTVKWVTNVEIKDMAEDWTLQLEGVLADEVDRATFESCAAANCHQVTWTDGDGQVWTGVPLWMLAGRIDGGEKHGDEAYNQALASQGYTLEVIAADGYSAAFESARFDHNDDILVAHLVDDELLPEKHFPLRLVGSALEKSEMVGQIAQIKADLTAESVEKAAQEAEAVAPPPEPWTLELEGAMSESVDWGTFHDCAGCHRATWTDDEGQVWTGVPLWMLAGRIDDRNRHDAGAYNQELAEQGYDLEAIAADGYAVAFESARIGRDDGVLLAYQVDDDWLAEKYFPLRMVGTGLQKNEMVGQVAQIVAHLPDEASQPSADKGALAITGAVDQEQALSLADLQAMEVVEVEVEHPKKGMQTYRGVRLNDLLDLAGAKAEAVQLNVRASDGYQTQASMADVRACADCLVSFADGDTLYMVMPGMEGGLWVKDVVEIELQ